MTRLIYHLEDGYERAASPFDEAIRETANADSVWIMCPYISADYLETVLADTTEWRVITDVEAWVRTFGGSSRETIQELIKTNRERIHHFPDIHAKVVISDTSAVVGSANLTKKGVTKRTEMGVQIEDQDTIEELQDWFLRLWSESSSIDIEGYRRFIRSVSEAPTSNTRTTASIPSTAPRVNASFVDDEGLSIGEFESDEEVRETVVNILRMAPSQEWADSFFDLLADVILTWELRNDDPRLVTTLAQKDRIALSINNRYVLVAIPTNEPSVGFIIGSGTEGVEQFIEAAEKYQTFDRLPGEDGDQTPHWVSYTGYPKRMMDDSFRRGWMMGISNELDRASGSPYQRHHEPLVYRMAIDQNYRERILREAYNNNDMSSESQTSRGIKEALCRIDMPRGQVTLLKYLYENARPVSIEELANGIRGGDADSCRSILGPLSKRINNTPEISDEPGYGAIIWKTENTDRNYYELRDEARRVIDKTPRLLREFERDMGELRAAENPVIRKSEF